VTVVLGWPAKRSHRVAGVTAASALPTSKMLVWPAGLDDPDVNSHMEEALDVKAVPATGTFTLLLEGRLPLGGNLVLDYLVL
jgi:hypothetical protein